MVWLARAFYHRLIYWPIMVMVGLCVLIAVGAFIDEPEVTWRTVKNGGLVAAMVAYAVAYTRERRLFLRGMSPF
jgi:hypothetical protein